MSKLHSSLRSSSLPGAFFEKAAQMPDSSLYSQFIRHDSHDIKFSLIERTYSEVSQRVRAIASYLKSAGVNAADRVGIISATRPEWLESDLAVMSVGAVVISLYPSLVEAEIAYILFDSNVKVLFVENTEQLNKVLNVLKGVHSIPATEDRPGSSVTVTLAQIISFEDCEIEDGAAGVFSFNKILEDSAKIAALNTFDHAWYQTLDVDSLASIVYTSGTTGPQKGVIQTHGNHLANIRQAKDGGLYRDDSAIFMLLPLAHSFSKLMGYIGFIAGVRLQFASISDKATSKANPRRTLLDLSQSSCTVIPLVPRILEKMKDGLELQASRLGIRGLLLKIALFAASYRRRILLRIPLMLMFTATAFIRKSIRKKLFGGNFEYVISGGAKLIPEVNQFFADIEIEVLEGYGLTETCVATNCNRPGQNRIGSVGPVLSEDIEMRLADDGEILFRGPNIARGYLNQASATRKAWDSEGWFHTGDLGSISTDGYLSLTGRKKEILVTSGGKKISPERIEGLLKRNELISQAIMIGEGRPYCVAIITPNLEKLQAILTKYSTTSVADLFVHPDIIRQLAVHLDSVNSELASFESVKRVLLTKDDFLVDNGLLTPTLKMRRGPILKRYAEEVERLYQSSERVLVEN